MTYFRSPAQKVDISGGNFVRDNLDYRRRERNFHLANAIKCYRDLLLGPDPN